MAFAALTIDLNARLAKFEDDMARVRKSMGGLEKSAGVLKAGLGGIFAGVGVAGLAAFAKNGIDAADALKDMSDKLGVSVKDLASFKLAAEQSGTSLDDVGKGIARLTRSIGQAEGGNKELGKALTALGISARDPKEAFFQLADATEKIQDPSKRAALLTQVLGKNYQELIPLLNQGSAELRNSAKNSESFSDAMARLAPNADKFNDQLAQLKTNAAGAGASILVDLMPVLKGLIGVSLGVAEGFQQVGQSIGATFAAIANPRQAFTIIRGLFDDLEKRQIAFKKRFAEVTSSATASTAKRTPGGINLPADKPSGRAKGSSAKATDPLASLLSQTDTAKFAEYTKLQDLLNARFERGAVTGKQYAEALTVLRKGYFTEELKAYADQLEYNIETERLVADHLKDTEAALRDQKNAWSEAGATLKDEMMTPLEQLDSRLEYLNELFRRGAIDVDTFNRAAAAAFDNVGSTAQKAADLTKDPFTSAFNEMGSALSQFVTTGKLDFKSLVKDILAGLAKIELQKAITGIAGSLFGGSSGFGAGSAAKVAGGSLGTIPYSEQSVMLARQVFAKGGIQSGAGISAFSGQIVSKPTVFPFAKGIGLMGEAGAEAILPLKRGKDGKLGVGTSGGGGSTVVNIAIDASGTKTQGDEGNAGQLARQIEGAVMSIIVRQQRNGGLLAQS